MYYSSASINFLTIKFNYLVGIAIGNESQAFVVEQYLRSTHTGLGKHQGRIIPIKGLRH